MHSQNLSDTLLQRIRTAIRDTRPILETPFGKRPLIYADYTASGRALPFIEDFLQQQVLPYYANTHTEATASGMQTTAYREEARALVRQAVNANEEDLVIFCGSGATAAINKFVQLLSLDSDDDSTSDRPLVLIGPYEHHSNELPWRESCADVIRIPEAAGGGPDLAVLERTLLANQHRCRIVGSFSAASNVTGILTNQNAVTALLHQYGALSCWDFAAAAPYIDIDMNPASDSGHNLRKDAVFISPHKFIGGPGTPGLLIVKKHLIQSERPSMIGGGTVSYVTPSTHTYLPVGERREEGGTPGIVESIRAGLVFKLKSDIGALRIEQLETHWVRLIETRWRNHPSIHLLGENTEERISITSFRIRTEKGYLPHGFVVAMLNDLFGIQMRGGCSCAGPYGHQLLNLTPDQSKNIEKAVASGHKLLKPGWVRFNLNYFICDEEADFILSAVDFVAEHGLALLPYYQYDEPKDLWLFQGKKAVAHSLQDAFIQDSSESSAQMSWQALRDHTFAEAEELVRNLPYSQGYQPCGQSFAPTIRSLGDLVLPSDLEDTQIQRPGAA